jgi:hypothetical protein
MVVGTVEAGREDALRQLLDTMNGPPGMARPDNELVPFGRFESLHYARFVILADPTLDDMAVYGLPRPELSTYLAFFGDVDGPAEPFLAELVRETEPGLRQIFSHCDDFGDGTELATWLRDHQKPAGANYVNTVGRTVRQIREEAALHRALSTRVPRAPLASADEARKLRCELVEFSRAEVRAGRLHFTREEPTPWEWLIRHYFNLVAIPLIGLIAAPFLLLFSPILIFWLRKLEKTDPEICPRPDVDFLLTLKRLEDHDVTNQYTAFGLVKPGLFRRWLLTAVVALIDWGARQLFANGHLARVQTIHFARWVFLDDQQRVMFASNYDGGHEAYMDDFINKVAWGLNLVFSNGVGWPRTDWLIKRGARIEQRFKYFQRRHQLPTQVWYKAYPGLTLTDIRRNQKIQQGLSCAPIPDDQVLAWLRLL